MGLGRGEAASGLLGTSFGIGVFLALLFLAVHVLINLWAISTVDAVAHDAALEVALAADSSNRPALEREAIEHARVSLGRYAEQVEFSFQPAAEGEVALHVRAPGLRLLPSLLADGLGVEGLDRRIVIRSEARR